MRSIKAREVSLRQRLNARQVYLTLLLAVFITCDAWQVDLFSPGFAWAQVIPQLPPPFPTPPPPLPEGVPPPPPPSRIEPPPLPPPAKPELPRLRIFVREIRVVGSTVFSAEELSKISAPYTNREVTSEDLEALRMALTLNYINHGYVTSGAIIPDQSVTNGVLTIQIIEGKLSRIDVEGNEWFVPSYIRDRVALGEGPPVNTNALQERLQLLQETPGIARVNAELRPGLKTGESVLNVKVAEANPFKVWLETNNFLSPTVGAEQGLITVAHQNLTGHGDILTVQGGGSGGDNPIINARYTFPITTRDTTISVQYEINDFTVIESPFQNAGIKSKSDFFGITLRQPLYRTLTEEFAISLIGEREYNKTFLFGQPFPLVPGATENGVSQVAALRFSQEWVMRSSMEVLAFFSRFSVGINALGATTQSNDPDRAHAQFFAWLGQAQWARRIDPLRMQLISRMNLQVANQHLFPQEQIAVGGRYSVRGYREYTLIRDNAFLFSLEPRVAVLRSSGGLDIVQLAPFVDVGRSWNRDVDTPTPATLASIGFGVIWNIMTGSRFEVYWGQQLNHVPSPPPGGNLQDHGLSFQLILEVI